MDYEDRLRFIKKYTGARIDLSRWQGKYNIDPRRIYNIELSLSYGEEDDCWYLDLTVNDKGQITSIGNTRHYILCEGVPETCEFIAEDDEEYFYFDYLLDGIMICDVKNYR